MVQDHQSRTSVTLLGRLHHYPTDQAAWSDFVARYGPKILQWCRRWRLQEAVLSITCRGYLRRGPLASMRRYRPSGEKDRLPRPVPVDPGMCSCPTNPMGLARRDSPLRSE